MQKKPREKDRFSETYVLYLIIFSSAAIIFAFLENKMAQKWRTPADDREREMWYSASVQSWGNPSEEVTL